MNVKSLTGNESRTTVLVSRVEGTVGLNCMYFVLFYLHSCSLRTFVFVESSGKVYVNCRRVIFVRHCSHDQDVSAERQRVELGCS